MAESLLGRGDQMIQMEHRMPNKSLDRTAMSAVSGVIADSWPAAALMAVGQLGRSATNPTRTST